MSETMAPTGMTTRPGSEAAMSALFANMVIQQTNMALMFLGHVPSPDTGERVRDLDAARLFIDQLEMLELKTKGNLDKQEDQLIKQSLTSLRMAFVQAVESPSAQKTGSASTAAQSSGQAPTPPVESGESAQPETAEEEPRKKFTKKY
jgi:hypothetical protein